MDFTVCINNHNYAPYLGAAIESALELEERPDVIVVDDGSSDESRKVIEAFSGDSRVRAKFNPHRGQLASIIKGIECAETEYVCFLDSDDRFRPNHLAAMTEAFASHPACTIAWTQYVNSDGLSDRGDGLPRGITGPGAALTQLTWHKPRAITSCIGVRKREFEFLSALPARILRQWLIRGDDCLLLTGALSGAMRYASGSATVERRVHERNHFINNSNVRDPFHKYQHAYATGAFLRWAQNALDVPDPTMKLLIKEFQAWPCQNEKVVRCYRKAAAQLCSKSSLAQRLQARWKIR